MPKPTSQERRKQVLRERRAEEQRQYNREDANVLFNEAIYAYDDGDIPAADRSLKKALILDPNHVPSLDFLGQIHDAAGHHAEALGYLQRSRKLDTQPRTLYNIAVLHRQLGQIEEAVEAMGAYLVASKGLRDAESKRLRSSAESFVKFLRPMSAPEKSAPKKTAPPPARSPAPAPPPPVAQAATPPPKPPEPPRVAVQFFPPTAPAFSNRGTIADYFLRRQWTELQMAQNFEDLLCLPSLHGVDAYIYQQETVRKVLRHFKGRALLADEVGLGKTIEACLVLKEYWMRGLVRKALVLTPPSLVSQWKGELIEKFGLAPVSPEGPEFRRDPTQFWKSEALVVCSIAQARLELHAAAIAAVPWDMVIVDEAHCLKNRSSANWQLVDSLSKKFILMLTATPVENNLIELYNLITLLKPGLLATEPDFRKAYVTPGKPKAPKNPEQLRAMLGDVMIRNTRAAADVKLPRRIAASVPVTPSKTEEETYQRVSRFVAGRYRQQSGKHAPAGALDLMLRQAGSSPQALARSAAHALEDASWVDAAGRRDLEAIFDLSAGLDQSAKGFQLGSMLAGRQSKAVVFTEFLPTLDHLKRVCDQHNIPYSVFSGDLSRADKDAAIADFRDRSRVLLSTGAGGEGRNLQFADTIVNFDLPWNPMRIEQRVGRVHRIGQDHDVFVFNYCQEGTVEEQILRVLHDKVNMFELVVGEMDAILGTLDDARDFAEIVMDLWIAGSESGDVEQSFEDLARRLLDAKGHHVKVQELDEALFAHDFEV
ncbi:MAG: SNF2-related protein [Candidatus Solibacter sp.]